MRTFYEDRMALGSRIQIALVTSSYEDVEQLFRKLWLEVLLFEKRCSRFLPGSELSQFNRTAGSAQAVSPEFRDILLAARRMGTQTQGLYNPFVLPALQRAGYGRSLVAGYEDDDTDDHSSKSVVAVDRLEIGENYALIPYGTALDLGGCGKGYIGDVMAAMATEWKQLQGFWFSMGGDTVTYGSDERGRDWVIYLQPDPNGDGRIGEARAPGSGQFAVATSTTRYRQGKAKGRPWHHIIDPRTGLVANTDIELAVVCGPSLLVADVYASCLIIAGVEGLQALFDGVDSVEAGWVVRSKAGLQTDSICLTAYGT